MYLYFCALFILCGGSNGQNETESNKNTTRSTKATKRKIEDKDNSDVLEDPYIVIKIKGGRVRGRMALTDNEFNPFYAFRAMRYAEPPKRFEPSVPVKPWKEVYDATDDKNGCIQIPFSESGYPEAEDCLFINVYTPTLPGREGYKGPLPVMFWVHGGAIMSGDSTYNYYGPDYFMDEKVIVVTLNYRLGAFGFLSTGDNLCPGNNGLKDLIMGLKWTQENIEYFGGNKKNVTLFGESAGGALAMYLAQSPLTKDKGYFHRLIMQSGNTLCPWSIQRNPRDVANRISIASGCGIYIFSTQLMLDCLKSVDVNVLKLTSLGVFIGDSGFLISILNGLVFAPNIEPQHKNAAVVEGSYLLLKNGEHPSMPYLIGYNSEEALFLANNITALRPLLIQADAAPAILVPQDMYASLFDSIVNIAFTIRDFYFDFAPIILNSSAKILRYLSDNLFDRPTREIVSIIGRRDPVYYYRFSYNGKLGLSNTSVEGLNNVSHATDLNYLWRTNTRAVTNIDLTQFPKQDLTVRKRMLLMWTNFAKTGNPTPKKDSRLQNITWPTALSEKGNVKCLDIGVNLTILYNPEEEQYRMWKQLYTSYGNPVDTY